MPRRRSGARGPHPPTIAIPGQRGPSRRVDEVEAPGARPSTAAPWRSGGSGATHPGAGASASLAGLSCCVGGPGKPGTGQPGSLPSRTCSRGSGAPTGRSGSSETSASDSCARSRSAMLCPYPPRRGANPTAAWPQHWDRRGPLDTAIFRDCGNHSGRAVPRHPPDLVARAGGCRHRRAHAAGPAVRSPSV